MNPISDTAFVTCGARAADAASANPVCGDKFAKLFLNKHGKRVFDGFKSDASSLASIVARHRIIDDLLRTKLAENPDTFIVTVGAGFDSRPYRLDSGQWAEIDELQVIDFKNRILPINQCKNSLDRRSIDFRQERLADKLLQVAPNQPVVVVMEGVLVYLSEPQIREVIRSLQHAFPVHTLICDLNTRLFVELYGGKFGHQLNAMGAKFKFLVDEPSLIFSQAGYRICSVSSILGKSLEYVNDSMALFVVNWFMRTAVHGHTVHVFETPT